MEGLRRYIVNIAEIGASGLVCPPHPDPEHIISPFCRINFANGFRFLQTECLVNEDEPNWSTTFSFMFETVKDLSELSVEISAYDKNEPEAIYLGKALIDLHTIATGPTLQDFQLERHVGSPAGRVTFIVEMTEFCLNLMCCISNIDLVMTQCTKQSCSLTTKAKLEISYSERQDIRQFSETTEVFDCLRVRFQDIDPLTISGSVVDFENSFVHIILFFGASEDGNDPVWAEIGRCKLPLTRYHPSNAEMQFFQEDILGHDAHKDIQINGTIFFMNAPKVAQMLSGSNTENGVYPGPVAWPDIDVPKNCLAEIPKNGVGLDRFASLRSSICWRAPATQIGGSDLLTVGKQRKWTTDEDIQVVPRGWSLSVDSEGIVFFRYHPTKQTTWSDPRYLPPGWEQSVTLDGKVFFYSYAAKASTWIDPRGLPLGWDLVLESGGHTAKPMFVYRGMITTVDPRGLPARYSQHLDRNGVVYFKDHKMKTTSWDDPRADMAQSECLQVVEDYIETFNQAELKLIKAESDSRKLSGRAQDILLEMDNEIRGFRSWYGENEKRWLAEKDQREENDRKKLRQAEQKLKALRQKNSETLAKLEDKWKKDIADKREAVLAQHEFSEQELLKDMNDIKQQIERDRQQWAEDMIEMKKFAIRDQMQKCAKNRRILQQKLMGWIVEENKKSQLDEDELSSNQIQMRDDSTTAKNQANTMAQQESGQRTPLRLKDC